MASVTWRRIRTIWREVLSDHAMMMAAGLALHALLGALPALAAAAAIWGLVADGVRLVEPVERTGGLLPPEAANLLAEFVTAVPAGFGLGIGLAASLAFALWAAMRGASGLITALNIAYDRDEGRGWLRRNLVALAIALAGMTVMLLALAVLALPPLLLPRDGGAGGVLMLVRWPGLGLIFVLALGLLFRFAPSPQPGRPRSGWISRGAVVGTLLWFAASFGLSVYVEHVGSFGTLYGSLGSVVVAMMWFYLAGLSVLTGAELNAIREREASGQPPERLKGGLRRHERSGRQDAARD